MNSQIVDKMNNIEISKEYNRLEDNLFGVKVQNILNDNSILHLKYYRFPSLRDSQRGIKGLKTYIFEIKDEGTIVYEEFKPTGSYFARIHFIGFDANCSKSYQNLKSRLESIALNNEAGQLKEIFSNNI